ncbi:hypothetical protein [Shewanella sp. CG12_big_fil_rev_8_21_14_0_65_47_15]|uniref:hypothetical protein n=1 Tax=Shewanella sp. CG12_big_fil_rev_8_21_14_0_65_47_15 TaxID=1975537 RepID=UPI000CB9F670|nr:hypothetical protein [Shewanella sp. CG12_big_fil_rev_8_21_14_0_65_47_15]PIW61824.1 MAG: hypothetical protein COW15_06490 [Shewanella sp. CG12_big_fil_rev_8_21_14_0_65_47_15]
MKHNVIVKNYLSSVLSLIDDLSDSDLAKLESGKFELSIKLIEKAGVKVDLKPKSESELINFDLLIEELYCVKSRGLGLEVIEKHLKLKSDLVKFAKYIDVAFLKSDRVEKIKETIVDATVGAKLRSSAIQGKEM